MYAKSPSVARRVVAALSALAVVLGLTATAVALAPAASATETMNRIEVSGLQADIAQANPSPGSPIHGVADAWVASVRVRAVFSGSATYSINGGASAPLNSDRAVVMTLHDGVNTFTITHDGNTYPIEILHPWKITGFEVYDADAPGSLPIYSLRDAQFDPTKTRFEVQIPASVSSLQYKIYYDTPTDTDPTQYVWVYSGNPCDGTCESGEMTQSRGHAVGSYDYQIQAGWNGREGWGGFQGSSWTLHVTRPGSYSPTAVSAVSFSNPDVAVTESSSTAGVFTGAVLATATSVDMKPIFASGTATWALNGGATTAILSGAKATIPMSVGLNTITLTHRSTGGTNTVYTYKLVKAFPITGMAIRDASTNTVLWEKSGSDLTVVPMAYPSSSSQGALQDVVIPSDVANVQISMTYGADPTNGTGTYNTRIEGQGFAVQCPGNACESGEWSNNISLSAGVAKAAGPLIRLTPTGWGGPDLGSNYRVSMLRSTSTVTLTGISIDYWRAGVGSARYAVTPTDLSGTPTPTMHYQWQYNDGSDWLDIAGATDNVYVMPKSLDGKSIRVKAWASNGVAPDTAPVYSSGSSYRFLSSPAPKGVTVTPGDGVATVSWNQTSVGASVTSYLVTATSLSDTKTCSTSTLTCQLTGLTNGASYDITVKAVFGVDPTTSLGTASTAVTVIPGETIAPEMNSATITGTPTVGERLTAGSTGLLGSPSPIPMTYAWETAPAASGPWTAMPFNGKSTQLLGRAAEGDYVRVTVTATNGAGTVSKVSPVVGPVATASGFKPDFALSLTGLGDPSGMTVDSLGNTYVMVNGTLYKYAPGARAGDAAIATWTRSDTNDLFVAWPRLYADAANNIWIVQADGKVLRLAAGASEAQRPVYRFTMGSAGDSAMDANGLLYTVSQNLFRIYDTATGTLLRSTVFDLGFSYYPQAMTLLSDGTVLIVSAGRCAADIYEPGVQGSSTPIRSFALPCNWVATGVVQSGSGRIWISFIEPGGARSSINVYNVNATATAQAVLYSMSSSDLTSQLAVDPTNGQVYDLLRTTDAQRVVGFDEAALGLGAVPVTAAPSASAVTVSGDALVTATLTASLVGVGGLPAPATTFKWQSATSANGPWTDIENARNVSYTVAAGDAGKLLRASVTLLNSQGTVTVNSAATALITYDPTTPVVEFRGLGAGLYNAGSLAYLKNGRIAALSDGLPLVSILNVSTGQSEAMIRFSSQPNGISAARDGSVWVFVDNKLQKWSEQSPGTWTKARELEGPSAGYLSGANKVAEDAAGYLYVLFPYNKVAVFPPAATANTAQLREMPVGTDGVGVDIDGNVIVGGAGEGQVLYYEGGASTNTDRIASLETGLWVDNLNVDAAGRIWIYYRSGEVRAYNPRTYGAATAVYRFTPTSYNRLGGTGGALNFGVSPDVNGRLTLPEYNTSRVYVYDVSAALPAVPAETTLTVASVTISGSDVVSKTLTATVGAVTGYPAGTVSLQWQVSATGTGNWTDIPNATASTYIISGLYGDKYIRVKAWGINHAGTGTPIYSDPTDYIAGGPSRTQVGVIQASSLYGEFKSKLAAPWYLAPMTGSNFIVSNRFNNGSFKAGFSVFPQSAVNNIAPSQFITFPNIAEAWGATQTSSGTLLLSAWLNDSTDHIYEVAGNSNGTPTPTRDLHPGCGYGEDVAVGPDGLIYVACWQSSVVKVFAANADGDATPLRTIAINGNPSDVGFAPDGSLFVIANPNLYYFAAGASGSDTPTKSLEGLAAMSHMTFDTAGHPIIAADYTIKIYPAGFSSTTPLVDVRSDDYTLTDQVSGIVYDSAANAVWLSTNSWRVQRFNVADLLEGDPVAPGQVTGLRSTPSDKKFVLNWTAPANATRYVATVAGGGQTFGCRTSLPTCTFDTAGTWYGAPFTITNGTTYTVSVKAYNRDVEGPASTSITTRPSPGESDLAPPAPTGVRGTGRNGAITVSWTAPPGSPSTYVARAVLGNDPALTCTPSPRTATTCRITGATTDATYKVQVKATRSNLSSGWSTAAMVYVVEEVAIGEVVIAAPDGPKSSYQIVPTAPKVFSKPTATVVYTWQSSDQADTGFTDLVDGTVKLANLDLKLGNVGTYIRLKVVADNGIQDPVTAYSNVIGEVLGKNGETKAMLQKVTDPAANAVGMTMNIAWTAPVLGDPTSYTVTLKPKTGTTLTRTYTVDPTDGDRLRMGVGGLMTGMLYTVTVMVSGQPATVTPAVADITEAQPGVVKGVSATVSRAKVAIAWSAPSTTFVGKYVVTLTPSSGRTYSMTTTARSATWSVVLNNNYTLKIVAITDTGVTGVTYTRPTPVVVSV